MSHLHRRAGGGGGGTGRPFHEGPGVGHELGIMFGGIGAFIIGNLTLLMHKYSTRVADCCYRQRPILDMVEIPAEARE